jgi:hypothetical protein
MVTQLSKCNMTPSHSVDKILSHNKFKVMLICFTFKQLLSKEKNTYIP